MGSDRRQELLGILGDTPLFAGLDEAHLGELVAKGVRRRYAAGEAVFWEGDRAEGLHVVLSGRVKVFKLSPKGREQTLMIMGEGEPVGEVAVLSGEAYPASAETLGPAETLYIPRKAFLDLVTREPEMALRLLSALSARLRSFASLIEDLSLKDVSQRLAAHLLALAEQGGEAESEGTSRQTVELTVTKAQLSAAVGTVPETLSRAFQQLVRAGAVETAGRTVHIKDRDLLARVAQVRT
jgi:CRP/FNR family transcriptional regulator, dissimilatory nitrate respiration regulator